MASESPVCCTESLSRRKYPPLWLTGIWRDTPPDASVRLVWRLSMEALSVTLTMMLSPLRDTVHHASAAVAVQAGSVAST